MGNPSVSSKDLEKLLSMPTANKSTLRKRKSCDGNQLLKTKRCKMLGVEDSVVRLSGDSRISPEERTVTDDQNQSITEKIHQHLVHRNECTVQVSGLPVKCDSSILMNLAPKAQSCRVLWNPSVHGSDGIAFLEFSSKALAESHQKKLDNSQYLNRTISARIGKFLPEDVALYDCRKLVVYGLHWKTRVGEIARRFPTAQNIDIRPLSKRTDRRRPERAFLTFADAEAALRACDSKQGCMIRKRKLSILWARVKSRTEDKPSGRIKYLLLSGVRSSVSEADIQSVFPQAASITINRPTGKAWLTYDLEEDCILDYKNSREVVLKGRKLKTFLHRSDKLGKHFEKERSTIPNLHVSNHGNSGEQMGTGLDDNVDPNGMERGGKRSKKRKRALLKSKPILNNQEKKSVPLQKRGKRV